jgi:GT2 family glycosyltransferase
MNRKISVLTTLYNHEAYIVETLRSSLSQSLPPSEVIVVDDASTDGSVAAARTVRDPRLHILAQERNLGGANTRLGFEACGGDYIAILNSDDVWESEKLEKQMAFLDANPRCGAVFTHVQVIDEHGVAWEPGTSHHMDLFNVAGRDAAAWARHFFHIGNAFCASSALIRRSCLDAIGGVHSNFMQLQDLDMWLRIVLAGWELGLVEQRLTRYRVSRAGSNMSAESFGARSANLFETTQVLQAFWGVSSLDLLRRVFPDLQASPGASDQLTQFYLARHAARSERLAHRLFAIETMHRWAGHLPAMQEAFELEGFDHRAYRDFIAATPLQFLIRSGLKGRLSAAAESALPFAVVQRLKAWRRSLRA